MENQNKLGGFAALYEALAYLVGFMIYIFVVDYTTVTDPVQRVALMADNQTVLYLTTIIVYVLFGVFLVPLALSLHSRLKASAPAMMKTATAFGLIWACVVIAAGMIFNIGMGTVVELYSHDPGQAATVWLAIDAIFEGIGGGVEILGGLWILLLSWAALRGRIFSKGLNYLGMGIGIAGIISLVPPLGEIGGMIFGLGQIAWFIWIGVALLRSEKVTGEN